MCAFRHCTPHIAALSLRYIVLPFYKWTLKSYFKRIIDSVQGEDDDEDDELAPPTEREVLLIMVQVCEALVHLQRHHVVHRDVKV